MPVALRFGWLEFFLVGNALLLGIRAGLWTPISALSPVLVVASAYLYFGYLGRYRIRQRVLAEEVRMRGDALSDCFQEVAVVSLAYRGFEYARDIGMLTIDDRYVHFNGLATSFALSANTAYLDEVEDDRIFFRARMTDDFRYTATFSPTKEISRHSRYRQGRIIGTARGRAGAAFWAKPQDEQVAFVPPRTSNLPWKLNVLKWAALIVTAQIACGAFAYSSVTGNTLDLDIVELVVWTVVLTFGIFGLGCCLKTAPKAPLRCVEREPQAVEESPVPVQVESKVERQQVT